ncbi:MAG: YafY family protein [Chloroflexota bacterium]|nr:YafY family protein [Chloroflexota bacterium]
MRADRLLAIVLLLQNKARVTATELADRLEVSERTIYRDMDALSTAGIPVISERGNQGGWRLLEGYRANLSTLNLTELQTLFLNQPLFADLGMAQTAQNALLKLMTSVSDDDQQQIESINQRFYIDPIGWQREPENTPYLSMLQTAIWNDLKITITYRRADHTLLDRTVSPLGLIAKGGIWYLAGEAQGDIHTYRISRILMATITGELFTRTKGFDLKTYWHRTTAEHTGNMARYPAKLRVSPHSLARFQTVEAYFKIDWVQPSEADEWNQATIYFGTLDEALEFVLSFGSSIEVIEPDTLRLAVIRNAEGMITLYKSNFG